MDFNEDLIDAYKRLNDKKNKQLYKCNEEELVV